MSAQSDPHNPQPAPLPVPNPSKSFWHSEPSSFLLGHHTTEDMPKEVDVVIVGSGITGASAARFLHESGSSDADQNGIGSTKKTVVMLEAREACWGATGRNGGHLQPLLFDRTSDIAAFELKNCAEVATYIKRHDIACEYRAVTGCRTFWTDELLKEAIHAVQDLKKQAPDIGAGVDVVTDKAELHKHWVSASCPGATLTKGAASLWPYKYVAHILESLIKAGALNLQTNTPATSIEPISTAGHARWTVSTARGSITAHHVLLATNAYTSHLVPSFTDLVVPCRGTMTALVPPPQQQRRAILLPNSYGLVGRGPGANAAADDYLVQRPFAGVPNPAGHLMFGGGRAAGRRESVGDADDAVVDSGCVDYLRAVLLQCLDVGADGENKPRGPLAAEYAWSGVMGYSRDNAPWVGGLPGSAGLWLCAGYTGHGMPNATLCAKAVVGMMDAEERGELLSFQNSLVERGELPRSYVLSQKRIDACRQLPTVKAQDESGVMSFVSHSSGPKQKQ